MKAHRYAGAKIKSFSRSGLILGTHSTRGSIRMLHEEKESETLSPRQRDLVVAYLSYALEDVRALSEAGSHLLQMTIATITEESSLDTRFQPLQSTTPH
jgi:hypothetical protein